MSARSSSPSLAQALAQGRIVLSRGRMLWGSNYAELITVIYESMPLSAVYKPQRGERPLWDFPEGTLCYREVLAYEVSEALGWAIVPPTVLREGPRGLGSVQLYVEHDPEINYFNLGDRFVVQLQRIALFDFIVNNADRKGGHILLDQEGHLWGIDHGLTFHAQDKLRTVIWEFAGRSVSAELWEDVRKFGEFLASGGAGRFGCYLSEQEMLALEARVGRLLRERRFPLPGVGSNSPWPLV